MARRRPSNDVGLPGWLVPGIAIVLIAVAAYFALTSTGMPSEEEEPPPVPEEAESPFADMR